MKEYAVQVYTEAGGWQVYNRAGEFATPWTLEEAQLQCDLLNDQAQEYLKDFPNSDPGQYRVVARPILEWKPIDPKDEVP